MDLSLLYDIIYEALKNEFPGASIELDIGDDTIAATIGGPDSYIEAKITRGEVSLGQAVVAGPLDFSLLMSDLQKLLSASSIEEIGTVGDSPVYLTRVADETGLAIFGSSGVVLATPPRTIANPRIYGNPARIAENDDLEFFGGAEGLVALGAASKAAGFALGVPGFFTLSSRALGVRLSYTAIFPSPATPSQAPTWITLYEDSREFGEKLSPTPRGAIHNEGVKSTVWAHEDLRISATAAGDLSAIAAWMSEGPTPVLAPPMPGAVGTALPAWDELIEAEGASSAAVAMMGVGATIVGREDGAVAYVREGAETRPLYLLIGGDELRLVGWMPKTVALTAMPPRLGLPPYSNYAIGSLDNAQAAMWVTRVGELYAAGLAISRVIGTTAMGADPHVSEIAFRDAVDALGRHVPESLESLYAAINAMIASGALSA